VDEKVIIAGICLEQFKTCDVVAHGYLNYEPP
jgi:hypothetical protein